MRVGTFRAETHAAISGAARGSGPTCGRELLRYVDRLSTAPSLRGASASSESYPSRVTGWQRFYTIAETADVLATSPAQVYALLRRGELRGFKLGGRGQWRVGLDDVEAFIAHAYEDTATWVSDNPFQGHDDTDHGGDPDNPPPDEEPLPDRPGDR